MGIDPTKSSSFDPSDRAESLLDHVLDEDSPVTQKALANQAVVEDELRKEQIIKEESMRIRSRVLFITRDVHVLEKDSSLQKHFISLQEVFDEVHIVFLSHNKNQKSQSIRLAQKVWVYPAVARRFLALPFAAMRTVQEQLHFTDGFRPDLVVALDPFESGVSGYRIAKKFQRPFQVHVGEDFFVPHWNQHSPYRKWRLRFARYVLKRTQSVRVETDTLLHALQARYKKIKDTAVLPRYFNIQESSAAVSVPVKKDLYPQFSFVILFVGDLTQDSTLFRAMDAVRAALRTPTVGFVVVGDGTAKESFQKRAQILGIEKQIIFTAQTDGLIPHMRSADLLVCTDNNSKSEDVIIKAAIAHVPMVIAKTILREDLFRDGEDAFLCDANDTVDFSQKIMKLLNTNILRRQFARNAQEVISTRVEEKPEMYRLAYRDSIEAVLYAAQEETATKKEKVS